MAAGDLQRFVEAQAQVYGQALAELRAGRKRTHWMWFVFPQIAGLGSSATAVHFAIRSMDEAQEYLAHPLLGARLREATGAVCAHAGTSLEQVFGYTDDLKFRSSMTLFQAASGGEEVFSEALRLFCDGPDGVTLALL